MCWTLAFLKRGREKKQYLLGVFVGVDQTTCEFFFISHTISNEYVSATISESGNSLGLALGLQYSSVDV